MSTTSRGREAEALVRRYLNYQGWTICCQNYRRHGFELDIVGSRPDGTLLIAEVKFRLNFDPQDIGLDQIISHRQFERLKLGATHFLSQSESSFESIRLDLFVVTGAKKTRLYRYKNLRTDMF